jgi:hypothetical protein
MRVIIVGLVTVALMCVCGVARPSIIYNVNFAIGADTVSGTITTNGTLSPLIEASDIIAWDLTAIGPVEFGPHSESGAGVGVTCSAAGDCSIFAFGSALIEPAPSCS